MPVDSTALLQPLSPDNLCGEDLEDTQLLASFGAYRVFGKPTPLPATIAWREIRDGATDALQKSRDLRLLTYLGAALIRTDGLGSFVDVLKVAGSWLETWWEAVYPRVDDDAVLRRNALSGFADLMAIVDGVRRIPILVHRQLGTFSIRDIEIALRQIPPTGDDANPPGEAQLNAMLAAVDIAALQLLDLQLGEGVQGLATIEKIMRDRAGEQAAPDYKPLTMTFSRTRAVIAQQLQTRAGAMADSLPEGASPDGRAGYALGTVPVGAVRSRDDAIRTLDLVAEFFRRNEPSSPIPLFLERAKRLVAKDFLAILEDVAPDGLEQAKRVGGVRDQ